MRLSIKDAIKLGLIEKPSPLKKQSTQRHNVVARKDIFPQVILYDALRLAMPDVEIIYEAKGVIPNRKFRIDIYIPATRLAIEMDGFQYHRSKDAFQSDRMRQNILVENNIAVLRFFTKQILNSLEDSVNMIKNIHNSKMLKEQNELSLNI